MMDRETEARVWQRVRGKADWKGDLNRLIRLCRTQTGDLRALDRELWHREKQTLQLLTGLYELCTGSAAPQETTAAELLSPARRLRRCQSRCEEMLALCIRLETHPRYGAVFTDLARQRRVCCAKLALLMQRE